MLSVPIKPPAKESHAVPSPVLKVTRYDTVTSFMLAVIIGLLILVAALTLIWLTNSKPMREGQAELEIFELPGKRDGKLHETPNLESPDDPVKDPQIDQMLENVVELSNKPSEVQPPWEPVNGDKKGSAEGTGERPLGPTEVGPGGREQKWFVRFSDRGSLEMYARQLDFFDIELAVLVPGKVTYIKNVSTPRPTVVVKTNFSDEKRLYMTWRGGSRRQADIELLRKAGVSVAGGVIYHFYPKETEARLVRLEREYAGRKNSEIRRTYFSVQGDGAGFRFVVTRQSIFRRQQ